MLPPATPRSPAMPPPMRADAPRLPLGQPKGPPVRRARRGTAAIPVPAARAAVCGVPAERTEPAAIRIPVLRRRVRTADAAAMTPTMRGSTACIRTIRTTGAAAVRAAAIDGLRRAGGGA